MLADDYANLQETISSLIEELHNPDGLKRQEARLELIRLGKDVTPALIECVVQETGHARWEAIEALERLKDPEAAPALVEALMDEEKNNRWAASNALIALDRAAIKPLLLGVTENFNSTRFREVAHHILHVLKDRGSLLPKEREVFEALEGIEPAVEVPWAAQKALEDLDYNRKGN